MHNIRWDDLQFIQAVAAHGSLSAAARALGVNHATVLRRIVAVEERIGVALFVHPPGGYRARPEIHEVLAALDTIEKTVGRLERILPTLGKGLEGPFRVTTTDSIADLILPRHLRDLARLHPKLAVELVAQNAPLDMTRPEAEITLRPALRVPEGLVGEKICDMSFGAFAHAAYLAQNTVSEVTRHRWLGVSSSLSRSPVGAWQDTHVSAEVVLKADSFLTLARMAEEGLGIAVLPSFVGRANASLTPVPWLELDLRTSIWVAAHPDLAATSRVRTIMTFFANAIATDADLLA